ncbi:hypothetical protein H0H93_000355 [Arthromyces matolae]|nr:hypothetical protein H0H93_000355 [Arthromyces matolae]
MDPVKSGETNAPIPVEESRAQRLQRSQARFRDRGGIFVPTTRNTLVDILLGRKAASPKKSLGRGRSVSLSPKKKINTKDTNVPLRTSPRKAVQMHNAEVDKVAKRPTAEKGKRPGKTDKTKAIKHPPVTKGKGKAKHSEPFLAQDDKDTNISQESSATAAPKPAPKVGAAKRTTEKGEKHKEDTQVSTVSNSKSRKSRNPAKHSTIVEQIDSNAGHDIATDQTTCWSSLLRTSSSFLFTTPTAKASKSDIKPKRKKSVKADQKLESEALPLPEPKAKTEPKSSKSKSNGSRRKATVNTEHAITSIHSSPKAGPSEPKIPPGLDELSGNTDKDADLRKARKSSRTDDSAAATAKPQGRTKRSRPVDTEAEVPLLSKRIKQAPSNKVDSPTPPKNASKTIRRKKKGEEGSNASSSNNEAPTGSPSRKRARETGEESVGAKRKRTERKDDLEAVPTRKPRKPPVSAARAKSKTSKRTQLVPRQATRTSKLDVEPGVVLLTSLKPRKSVMLRMNQPDPDQTINNDPDPIDFLR